MERPKMTKGRMNRGGPEWRKWCAMYEDVGMRRRLRAERRRRRDTIANMEQQR